METLDYTLDHHQVICAEMEVAGEALDRGKYGAREELLRLCRSLIALLETPLESLTRMWWAEVSEFPANIHHNSGQPPC